ncbi:MAG: (2Fe-2S)-binding protein, partial [Candidatus Limnocylindrales bacterium]
DVEVRLLLTDFIRREAGLTGTHVGCEQGVCGACDVLFDGQAIRSCLTLAVQASGHAITTIEGIAPAPGELHPVQAAFKEHHALQCGFCTAGFVVSACSYLDLHQNPTREEIREGLSGNLCRCTGYKTILDAVEDVASQMSPG